jgi:coenzyme F420-reducing hydrogenase delta subunit
MLIIDKQKWFIIFGVLMLMNIAADFSRERRMSKKLRLMQENGNGIVDRVQILDAEFRVRDSILMIGVRQSMDRIERLSRLRAMTMQDIKKLEDSISVERERFDSLSNSMLEW